MSSLTPNEWPNGAPSPTYANGSKPPYRIVVTQHRSGGQRYCFPHYYPYDLAQFRAWVTQYPEADRLELDEPTTGVYLDTLQSNGTYMDETLKPARTPTFAETVNPSRVYEHTPADQPVMVNPVPMTPDPVLSNYFNDEIERLIVGQKITPPDMVVSREQLINATVDLAAANAQRVADNLTARRREQVIANAVSEQASGGPNPIDPHEPPVARIMASRDVTVRTVLDAWRRGAFPSFESAMTHLSATLLDELTTAHVELARLHNERNT